MTASTHISTSGGLISTAFIENIREPGSCQGGVEPESFDLPWSPAPGSPAAMEETVAAAWELVLERWDAVRAGLPAMDVSQVRARWLLPLFQALDFDPLYLRGDTVLDREGRLRFPLSHRGWDGDGAPILHTVLPAQELDNRPRAGLGTKARSPHDMLQAYLNASPGDRWALLSNGILLRLLRDYHHTFTKGYVQFDLESILETRNYGDFRALYRMCHASRFLPPPSPTDRLRSAGGEALSPPSPVDRLRAETGEGGRGGEGLCPLEQFYKDSIATGIRIGEDLRGQVRRAIETLGNGFLDGELIGSLQADTSLCQSYYSEILRIIYRILFLLYAEQRGMMPGRDSLYAEVYSISALRARAEGDLPREDDFCDLWEGLKVTFRLVREGVPALGVFGYDGMLFEEVGIYDNVGAHGRAPVQSHAPLLAGQAIRNSDLLHAIRALTLIEREGVLQRISYADLGVEELGSIYESLLDYSPRVTTTVEAIDGREVSPNTFVLDPRGSARKTTGSYYTHPSLVNELIKSALLPVARERLQKAGLPAIEEKEIGEAGAGLLTDYAGLSEAQRAAGERALLSIKVCDAAGGSGHFVVKANNALGAELARIRSGDEYPSEAEVQVARRDVLAHCIYAVDLNPMAVELCKVSLWINASVRDRPLSFLDHHIRCGNSLIGATPELLAGGIPAGAFALGIAGDDREVARRFRAQNRAERSEIEKSDAYQMAFQVTVYEPDGAVRREYVTIGDMAEDEPHQARERYLEYLAGDALRRRKLEADAWTAAFFWPLTRDTRWAPTYAEFARLQAEGPEAFPTEALAQIEALARRYRFFHWHLEFPDVFGEEGGGFDVILGNPPWESLEFKTEEFFASRAPEIASAPNAAVRNKMIAALKRKNPDLYAEYQDALRELETVKSFVRYSKRFCLTNSGTINLYALFAETDRSLVATGTGRLGIVVQTSLASEWTYRGFFREIIDNKELVSLHDFQNRRSDGSLWFNNVDSRLQFCLLTLSKWPVREAKVSFFTDTMDGIYSEDKAFQLLGEDIIRINPNTLTIPIFRYPADANLTRKIHRLTPAMIIEDSNQNDWQIVFKQGLFNISSASVHFRERGDLAILDYDLNGNWYFGRNEDDWLPVYEDWMVFQFDHRYNSHDSDYTVELEHQDPTFIPLPRYWVEKRRTLGELAVFPQQEWFVVFRDRARTTDARTAIFAVVPLSGITHPLPMIGSPLFNTPLVCAALANFNSFVFDYATRQKMSGYHLAFYILKQQPTVPPSRYTPDHLDFIVPRVVELTYTAWDLQPFARDVLEEVGAATWARWFEGDHLGAPSLVHTSPPPEWAAGATPRPFVWDEERRARLRAELDALYAHLYGLTREELAYVLETFPIVRRKDEARWGEYRTKRIILKEYDKLTDGFK